MESQGLTGGFLCAFPNSEKPQPSDGQNSCLAFLGGAENNGTSSTAGQQPFLQSLGLGRGPGLQPKCSVRQMWLWAGPLQLDFPLSLHCHLNIGNNRATPSYRGSGMSAVPATQSGVSPGTLVSRFWDMKQGLRPLWPLSAVSVVSCQGSCGSTGKSRRREVRPVPGQRSLTPDSSPPRPEPREQEQRSLATLSPAESKEVPVLRSLVRLQGHLTSPPIIFLVSGRCPHIQLLTPAHALERTAKSRASGPWGAGSAWLPIPELAYPPPSIGPDPRCSGLLHPVGEDAAGRPGPRHREHARPPPGGAPGRADGKGRRQDVSREGPGAFPHP